MNSRDDLLGHQRRALLPTGRGAGGVTPRAHVNRVVAGAQGQHAHAQIRRLQLAPVPRGVRHQHHMRPRYAQRRAGQYRGLRRARTAPTQMPASIARTAPKERFTHPRVFWGPAKRQSVSPERILSGQSLWRFSLVRSLACDKKCC